MFIIFSLIGGKIVLNLSLHFAAVCVDLPPLENGMIVYNMNESPRPIGTVATHSCNNGFFLNGAMTRTCVLVGSAGMFDGVAPTCNREF